MDSCAKTLLLIAALLGFTPAIAQQLPDEEVVVTANAYPVPFGNLSRAVTVLNREDIRNLPAHSIADVLALATSVDLRARAPFGIQTDISVRGSAFSQVLVMVDGVRINDSQTGHHNSDFPVQLQDVERIEVLLGPGSSIYGADAFGGIINIITQRDSERMHASVSGGQHGFAEGSFSAGFRKGNIKQSISVTGNRSSGFQADRDFRNIAVSARTTIDKGASLFVSHVNKEFGAFHFYGPSASKEWTDQTLVSYEQKFERKSGGKAFVQGYFRSHGDRFLYDIEHPDLFESSHRTGSAGVIVKGTSTVGHSGSLTIGGELGGDWIGSARLGDHSFTRTSLFTELQWAFGKNASVYPGFRVDYYSNFGAAASPSLSGSWWILPRLRLRSSIGRAFRIPTFTELYYKDPNHQASNSLKPESAWSAEIGTDFIPAKKWMGSMTLFARRERNVIDWVRTPEDLTWRTANMHRLRTAGAEFGLERSLGSRAGFGMRYSRIATSAGAVDFDSKYVLDYARDSWSASTFFPLPLSLSYRQTLNYKRRADGRSYWIMDGRLEREFRKFAIGLDFTNLFDSRYQEVRGIDMPGRWFVVSIRTN